MLRSGCWGSKFTIDEQYVEPWNAEEVLPFDSTLNRMIWRICIGLHVNSCQEFNECEKAMNESEASQSAVWSNLEMMGKQICKHYMIKVQKDLHVFIPEAVSSIINQYAAPALVVTKVNLCS